MSKLRKYISEGRYEEVNAIEIPENATNGDVIKLLFPQIEVKTVNLLVEVFYLDSNDRDTETDFYANWWNAPYKAESEK